MALFLIYRFQAYIHNYFLNCASSGLSQLQFSWENGHFYSIWKALFFTVIMLFSLAHDPEGCFFGGEFPFHWKTCWRQSKTRRKRKTWANWTSSLKIPSRFNRFRTARDTRWASEPFFSLLVRIITNVSGDFVLQFFSSWRTAYYQVLMIDFLKIFERSMAGAHRLQSDGAALFAGVAHRPLPAQEGPRRHLRRPHQARHRHQRGQAQHRRRE